tara:strand:- start:395 stop:625 length:231 start_codon:yes stop_codon:yes gene_type:complete
MSNFKLILAALRVAKNGAEFRNEMGMSLGDNAYGDCLKNQVEDLLNALNLGENDVDWSDHIAAFRRFRGAFNRAVY